MRQPSTQQIKDLLEYRKSRYSACRNCKLCTVQGNPHIEDDAIYRCSYGNILVSPDAVCMKWMAIDDAATEVAG